MLIDKGIAEIRSFLSEDACQRIVAEFNDLNDSQLDSSTEEADLCGVRMLSFAKESSLAYWSDLAKQLTASLRPQIDQYFSEVCPIYDPSTLEMEDMLLLEYDTGAHSPLHVDGPAALYFDKEKGEPFGTHRPMGALIYLNSDYLSGETVFPDQDRSIVPETGKLLLFPLHYMYPHAGNPPFGEKRYVLQIKVAQHFYLKAQNLDH